MTAENKEQHGLYTAAVSFMVSERTQNDAWEHIAKFVGAYKGTDLAAEFKLIEQQIKTDYSITTMPGAWRSAKSTALTAHAKGVPVMNGDGQARGKTEVSRAWKGKAVKVVQTDYDKLSSALVDAYYILDHSFEWPHEHAKTTNIEFVQTILKRMKTIKVK